MAIIEQLQHNAFDDSDPDDFRPNSTWAIACDPSNVEGSYVSDLAIAIEVLAPGDRVPCTRTQSTKSYSLRMVSEFELGPETRTVQPGTIVFVPAGTPHALRAVGEVSVRFLGSESKCSTEIRRPELKATRRSLGHSNSETDWSRRRRLPQSYGPRLQKRGSAQTGAACAEGFPSARC
jgi:hypothetical protein